MKIYIDLLIIQDTAITYLILFLLCKLLNFKIGYFRLFVISILNSILSVCLLVFAPKLLDNLLIKFIFSIMIVKFIKVEDILIHKIFLLFTITFLFGGIGLLAGDNLIVMFGLILFSIFIIVQEKQRQQKQLLIESTSCLIDINYKNHIYHLKALIDTGNNVTTLFGENVIFVKENLFDIEGGDDKHKRIVSYQTVSGKQKSIGIKVFNINVSYGSKNVCNNAVIVRTPNILNNFDAIIGYHLIEGGWTNGNTVFNQAKGKETIP